MFITHMTSSLLWFVKYFIDLWLISSIACWNIENHRKEAWGPLISTKKDAGVSYKPKLLVNSGKVDSQWNICNDYSQVFSAVAAHRSCLYAERRWNCSLNTLHHRTPLEKLRINNRLLATIWTLLCSRSFTVHLYIIKELVDLRNLLSVAQVRNGQQTVTSALQLPSASQCRIIL